MCCNSQKFLPALLHKCTPHNICLVRFILAPPLLSAVGIATKLKHLLDVLYIETFCVLSNQCLDQQQPSNLTGIYDG